ncbi:MAG: tRNA-dihydrouridine synthase family protein [Victivallales bacterium]|nr:tRNA-dihydrouridine synthase family protein [Victivallales bacterium]
MQILAAPIQEYTDAAFRNAHYSTIGGIDEYYIPFLRLENGLLSHRIEKDIAPENNRCPCLVPQILVKNASETHELLEMLTARDYRRIDFNFCCPFPKVTSRGYGSGILKFPRVIQEVLSEAAHYENIRFSAKLRLGMEHADDCMALLPILNDFPFEKIVLHPRTAKQQYMGIPDREVFRRFQEACQHNVIYNGDIICPADAIGLDDIMIGRGLFANPLLPLTIRGQSFSTTMLTDFHNAYVSECMKLYQQPLLKLKLLWDYFLPDADKKLRKAIKKSVKIDDYLRYAAEALFLKNDTEIRL